MFELKVKPTWEERKRKNNTRVTHFYLSEYEGRGEEVRHWACKIAAGQIQGEISSFYLTDVIFVNIILQVGDQFNLYVEAHDGAYFCAILNLNP